MINSETMNRTGVAFDLGRMFRTLLVFPVFTTVDQSNLCQVLPDFTLESSLQSSEDKKNDFNELKRDDRTNYLNLSSSFSVTSLDGTDSFSDVTKFMLGFFNTTQISYGKNTTKC